MTQVSLKAPEGMCTGMFQEGYEGGGGRGVLDRVGKSVRPGSFGAQRARSVIPGLLLHLPPPASQPHSDRRPQYPTLGNPGLGDVSVVGGRHEILGL